MNVMASRPSWLLIMVVAVLVIALVSAARRRRWMQRNFDVKVCPQCGASLPPHAGYCRQCGRKV